MEDNIASKHQVIKVWSYGGYVWKDASTSHFRNPSCHDKWHIQEVEPLASLPPSPVTLQNLLAILRSRSKIWLRWFKSCSSSNWRSQLFLLLSLTSTINLFGENPFINRPLTIGSLIHFTEQANRLLGEGLPIITYHEPLNGIELIPRTRNDDWERSLSKSIPGPHPCRLPSPLMRLFSAWPNNASINMIASWATMTADLPIYKVEVMRQWVMTPISLLPIKSWRK